MNPNATLNGWAAERPEDLLEVRIVEVRLTEDLKDLGPEIVATVDILASVDPWEFAKFAPPREVGFELDSCWSSHGTTELISLGDRTVLARNVESDILVDYFLFDCRKRIALVAHLGLGQIFFAGHGILREGHLAELFGPPELLNSRGPEERDWIYPSVVALNVAMGIKWGPKDPAEG
jgi:hypothetical protein